MHSINFMRPEEFSYNRESVKCLVFIELQANLVCAAVSSLSLPPLTPPGYGPGAAGSRTQRNRSPHKPEPQEPPGPDEKASQVRRSLRARL